MVTDLDLETRLRQQLKTEAQQATISDDALRAIRKRLSRRKTQPRRIMVLVSAAALIAAAIVVPLLIGGRETVDDLAATPSPAATSTPDSNQSSSGDAIDFSDVALRCFLDARVRRDFEAAKPCMTQQLIDSYSDPVGFIGPSSPNIQRFTILGELGGFTGSAAADAHRPPFASGTIVSVRAYIGSSTGLMSYSDDEIEVATDGERWLVGGWRRGEERPIGEAAEVTVYLPPTEALCDDIDASHLTAVRRRVAPTDNPALAAVQELLMGPGPAETAYGSFFPLGSRVLEVALGDSGGTVRLNEVATTGIPCVRALNRAALDMTIRPFVDPETVEVSPDF